MTAKININAKLSLLETDSSFVNERLKKTMW